MEQILKTIANQIHRNGTFKASTAARAIAYDRKHSMWKLGADPRKVALFNQIKEIAMHNGMAA